MIQARDDLSDPTLGQRGVELPLLRLIADAVPSLIAYYAVDGLRCRFANRRYAQYNGWTPESILGKTVREAIGEPAWQLIQPHVDLVLAGQSVRYEREQSLPDGGNRLIEVHLLPHFDENHVQVGAFVQINDVTDQRRAEHVIRESDERMRKFAHATDDGIVFHAKGLITDGNQALERMLGYTVAEMTGRPVLDFVSSDTRQIVSDHVRDGMEDPYEAVVVCKNGQQVPVEIIGKTMTSGPVTYRVAVVRDIRARKQAQARIEFLAMHDALTHLPNRTFLRERLDGLVAQAQRSGRMLAVLFVDLDNFKTVNDSLGHHAGDQLLAEIAARLSAAVRQADMVARLGGDEFVVVLAELPEPENASRVAAKLINAISAPVVIDTHRISISASIGIGIFPNDGLDADELIRNGDAAMYHAKDSGRSNYRFFTPEMSKRSMDILNLENQLREAIASGQFVLHFQPQVDCADGKLTGMEALVRWQHPQRGLVGPAEFIGFAEKRGLIVAIGRWVMAQACRQLKNWHDAGCPRVPVSVNLSAIEFNQHDLAQTIQTALGDAGLEPRFLELELTESALLDHDGGMRERLVALKSLGVRLAIDDFGTGYSSLAYLKRYPIDRLKIDRSFVQHTPEDQEDVAIVTAILQLAHSLKLRVVAEGVETSAQMALLRGLGCTDIQGYLVSRPIASGAMELFLRGPGTDGPTLTQTVSPATGAAK